jgi:hypothetical protein
MKTLYLDQIVPNDDATRYSTVEGARIVANVFAGLQPSPPQYLFAVSKVVFESGKYLIAVHDASNGERLGWLKVLQPSRLDEGRKPTKRKK